MSWTCEGVGAKFASDVGVCFGSVSSSSSYSCCCSCAPLPGCCSLFSSFFILLLHFSHFLFIFLHVSNVSPFFSAAMRFRVAALALWLAPAQMIFFGPLLYFHECGALLKKQILCKHPPLQHVCCVSFFSGPHWWFGTPEV